MSLVVVTFKFYISEKDEGDVFGLQDVSKPPVVEVVVQIAVANAEFERLEKLNVFGDVECVEDIEIVVSGENERVLEEILQAFARGDVVVGVCSF